MLPVITQQNVHLFIPYKVAYVVDKLQQESDLSIQQALLLFYRSDTYAQLEREETKRWQDNVKQLWADFQEERQRNGFGDENLRKG